MSTATQLYIIGGIDILLPVIALIVLRKIHTYRISSIICGIGSYFIAANFLMGLIGMLLSEVGITTEFWDNNPLIYEIVNGVFNTVLQSAILFLVMRFVLKGNVKIYDAMALGVSYWLYNALMLSTSAISYARMSQLDAQGRLAEMVTETLPLETLQTYASDLKTLGISSFYIQMLGVLVLMLVAATLTLFLFLGIKRKEKRYLFITMGAHFGILMILNICLRFIGNIGYVIANFVILIAAIFTLMQFMKWYRAQQEALRERRREYRERLKETGGTN